MKMTMSAYDMQEIMIARDRDYYSIEGLEALNEWYDEDTEFDPIEICGTWTEYGIHASLSIDEMFSDFGYLLDGGVERTEENLLDALNEKTFVIALENGDYLIEAF